MFRILSKPDLPPVRWIKYKEADMPNGMTPGEEGEAAGRAEARGPQHNPLIAALAETIRDAETRDIVYRGRDISAADPDLEGKALDEAFVWAINKLKAARGAAR